MQWLLLLHLSLFAAKYEHPSLSFEYNEKNWELVEQKAPTEPKSSQSVDSKMNGITVVTLQRRNADEKYRARFSVVVDNIDKAEAKAGETPLAAYTRYSQSFLKGQRFSVLESKGTEIGNSKIPGTDSILFQRDFGLKFRQVILVKGKSVYLLTFTSRMKPFDSYVAEIETLLSSLRLNEAQEFKHTS